MDGIHIHQGMGEHKDNASLTRLEGMNRICVDIGDMKTMSKLDLEGRAVREKIRR